MYNGILLSHKKEWNNAICSNMDRPRDYHTKWSKSDKDKYMISLICGIQKVIQMNLFTKQKQTHRYRKQTYGYQREKRGGINLEYGINKIQTTIYKIYKQQGPIV